MKKHNLKNKLLFTEAIVIHKDIYIKLQTLKYDIDLDGYFQIIFKIGNFSIAIKDIIVINKLFINKKYLDIVEKEEREHIDAKYYFSSLNDIINNRQIKINIQNSNIENMFIEDIIGISLCNLSNITGNLKIQNTTFNKDSKLHLKNLELTNLTLSNSSQEWSEAIFENIIIPKGGKLKLENIDLQKAKFVDCDFSECEIEISNSVSFKDTLFNSVNWGDISEIEAKRDIFRQLKFSNDSQGNFIEANNFYSEEMRRYEKENKSFSDDIIFKLNKYISNFGQNYFLPIFWFFIVTIGILINIEIIEHSQYVNIQTFVTLEISVLYLAFTLKLMILDIPIKTKLFKLIQLILLSLIISIYLLIMFKLNISFNEIAKFSIPKLNQDYKGYEFLWFLHKAILSILIYHLTIALRRQTKR